MKGGSAYTITFMAAPAPKPDVKFNEPLANELIVPYWLVRTTNNSEKANMHLSTMKCTIATGASKEESTDEAITIPILQNSKLIHEGEELFIYDEGKPEKQETLAPAPKPAAAPSQKRKAPSAPKRLNQPNKKARKR